MVTFVQELSRFTENIVRCCVQFEDVFGEASDRRNKYFYNTSCDWLPRYVDTGMEKMNVPWIYIYKRMHA